jgi:cytochrome bd-type quinol oxidase subunit 2
MSHYIRNIILASVAITALLITPVFASKGLQKAFDNNDNSPLKTVADKAGVDVNKNIAGVSGQVIKAALSLVGLAFLLLMVYAGFLWMTARGEDTQIEKARKIISSTIIGLVLVLSAYAITLFVTSQLGGD